MKIQIHNKEKGGLNFQYRRNIQKTTKTNIHKFKNIFLLTLSLPVITLTHQIPLAWCRSSNNSWYDWVRDQIHDLPHSAFYP